MGTPPPIELTDMCPRAQGMLFLRPDGRRVARWMPCRVKGCDWCGPRLRTRWAEEWGHAMGGEVVHRLVVDDVEVAKLRRRKVVQGHELGVIPAPDGRRVVYTTAPVGSVCEDVPSALSSDFAAMPNDPRRRSITSGWSSVIADAADEQAAQREQWKCEGRIGRSMEQVAMVATDLGVLVGRTASMLILEVMDPATENRFKALVKLQRGYHRRAAAA